MTSNTPVFARLPQHIAIIMDGNGRWAQSQGFERIRGHQKGVETVRRIVEVSVKTGISYLSLFAFSVENWNRPQAEVDALMELLILAIEKELPELQKNNIILKTIGDIERLPVHCQKSINESIFKTAGNTGMTLCIALSYSGKWDIIQATKKIATQCIENNISIEQITDEYFTKFLSTSEIPDPELLIRTSGETRISNFFLWQCAYSEMYFSSKFWPEFEEEDFYDALNYYNSRERRFGKISEQLL
jgi:undecaprenyl diphosphate synthase